MKNKKRGILALMLALLLCFGLLAGCNQNAAEAIEQDTLPEVAVNDNPVEEAKEDTDSVKIDGVQAEGIEITDMAGRTMTVPVEINSIFSDKSVTSIYIYTVAPDKLLGWNYELNDYEKNYILPEYQTLPSFGMGDSINYEAVIAAKPDIALSATKINDKSKEEADKLSESLGVPVIIIDDDLENAAEVYRFLGELLGVEEHAEKLALYTEKTFKEVANANIPESEQVTIYYGNGEDSLETAPKGSSHAQIFDIVKAINVADIEAESGGRIQVSLEQLLMWDPDYIILNGEPKSQITADTAAEEMKKNPDFASLKALQEGNVLASPTSPFSWTARPMGPNRIVGVRWLSKELYPDYYDYDIDEEVKEFFSLFYHTDLTDEQIEEVYKN